MLIRASEKGKNHAHFPKGDWSKKEVKATA
jgi:hypothetical protein